MATKRLHMTLGMTKRPEGRSIDTVRGESLSGFPHHRDLVSERRARRVIVFGAPRGYEQVERRLHFPLGEAKIILDLSDGLRADPSKLGLHCLGNLPASERSHLVPPYLGNPDRGDATT